MANRSAPEDIGRGTGLLALLMAACLVAIVVATCTGGAPARAVEGEGGDGGQQNPLISPIVSPIHIQKPPEPAVAVILLDTPVTVREPAPAPDAQPRQAQEQAPQPAPTPTVIAAPEPEPARRTVAPARPPAAVREISRLWKYVLVYFYGGNR